MPKNPEYTPDGLPVVEAQTLRALGGIITDGRAMGRTVKQFLVEQERLAQVASEYGRQLGFDENTSLHLLQVSALVYAGLAQQARNNQSR
jgi:hypothetical protein